MAQERQKEIKKIYARLLRLGIPEYLISSEFEYFCIEYDIDKVWDAAIHKIRSESSALVLIPGYTGDAEKAFELFLYLIDKLGVAKFKEIITALLIDYAKWSSNSIIFDEIKDSLLKLGFSETEFDTLIEKSSVVKSPTNKPGKRFFGGLFSSGEGNTTSSKDNIFIVHGHDHDVRERIARFIEIFDLKPIILDDVASSGRTIIEKLEANSDVTYAIVILTPDDLGKAKNEEKLKTRARQNVILELGYFMSHLGRDNVCVIHNGVEEIPSDYSGVIYIDLDSGEGWKVRLVKELKAAGFDIDMNKLT